ncbi:uncharacterized protein LOC128283874 [Gossypium arboreum]|uniref:uncharacterized protein LOC128283874 n=1 Tax=Gossypium arboreum TaxID=29729 RepID=UPI0022F1D40D|nr:uncharacterized protein LOC128283874 [Gossypium arboreum]
MGRGQRASSKGVGSTEVRQPALVCAARRHEDRDAPDIITSTFLIFNVPYLALIDLGSTHSYIASSVSEILGIPVEGTDSEVTVLSPLGQSVWVSRVYKDVPLEVQGKKFLVDLMELPFGEFDLILGMDWLVKHRVSLNCVMKRVVLRTKEDNEVVMIGERLKDIRTVRDFPDVFLEELPGLPPSRKVEFGIKLIPGIAPSSIAPF